MEPKRVRVLGGEVAGAVVREGEAGCSLVGQVEDDRGDRLVAELLRGLGAVVARAMTSRGLPVWVPSLTMISWW